jgi:hypothetical protein
MPKYYPTIGMNDAEINTLNSILEQYKTGSIDKYRIIEFIVQVMNDSYRMGRPESE